MIRRLLAAYKVITEQDRKQRMYEQLVGTKLNYQIIKDLVNSAKAGVVINIVLADGSKLEIRPEDAFERYKLQMQLQRQREAGTW